MNDSIRISDGLTVTGVTMFHRQHRIVSVTLTDEGMEVVRQYPSQIMYGNGKATPDDITKEIYKVNAMGKITLFTTIHGKHTPAYVVPEKIEF